MSVLIKGLDEIPDDGEENQTLRRKRLRGIRKKQDT